MTTTPVDDVLVEREGRIVQLTVDRPERRNAISLGMYSALADAIRAADQDDAIRVVVLSGTRGCFTSGNDLGDFLQDTLLSESHPTVRFMHALYDLGKPAVAAVCGPAVGIGTTLLLHCDFVYAGESARFQTPFVNLGLCPEYASSRLLPLRIGHVRAAAMLLLGETLDAHQALGCGLVNAVVDDRAALELAMHTAERLVRQPPQALRTAKRLMRESQRAQDLNAMQREIEQFKIRLQGAEFKAAADAFFAKRTADFSTWE